MTARKIARMLRVAGYHPEKVDVPSDDPFLTARQDVTGIRHRFGTRETKGMGIMGAKPKKIWGAPTDWYMWRGGYE